MRSAAKRAWVESIRLVLIYEVWLRRRPMVVFGSRRDDGDLSAWPWSTSTTASPSFHPHFPHHSRLIRLRLPTHPQPAQPS